MRKIERITAVILMICLLTGCAADTIYIQTITPTTTAPSQVATEEPSQTTADTPLDVPTDAMVWIPTKGGTKYHKTAACSSMQNPKQVSREEAEKQGFTPCKRCYE